MWRITPPPALLRLYTEDSTAAPPLTRCCAVGRRGVEDLAAGGETRCASTSWELTSVWLAHDPKYYADYLRHCPIALFELPCPHELSNSVFLTSTAIVLGTPVPHMLFLHTSPEYTEIDPCDD